MAQASAERPTRSVRPVHRHKGLIAITTVAVALSALFASLIQQKVYRATAVVSVGKVPAGQPKLTVAGEVRALRSAIVRSTVAKRGGTPQAVTAEADGGNDIEVTAKAGSARAAAALANGYVGVYIAQRQQELNGGTEQDLRNRVADLQRQIDAMTIEISQARPAVAGTIAHQRDGLVTQRNDMQRQVDALASGHTPLTVIEAKPPGGPAQPHVLRSVFVGLIVGFLFGLLLAVGLELWERRAERTEALQPPPEFRPVSRRLKEQEAARAAAEAAQAVRTAPLPPQPVAQAPSQPEPVPEPVAQQQPEPSPEPESEQEPEPAAGPEVEVVPAAERSGPGVPVLGMIPAVATWRSGRERPILRWDQPTTPAAEAYRNLAATVQRILPHRSLRSLVVTSPSRSDGKTTVAANIGVVMARAGKTVVIVDCDLRQAGLHTLVGLPNEAGFTSVLRGEAPLSRATQDVPGEPRLQLLAAGPPPTAPGQLLSAQRTMEVLTALQAQADIVIIDVPAVEPTGDAVVVASIVDAALMIAGAPSGQAAELARAVDLLDEIDGLVLGVVLNNVEDPDTDGRVAMLKRDQPRVSLA